MGAARTLEVWGLINITHLAQIHSSNPSSLFKPAIFAVQVTGVAFVPIGWRGDAEVNLPHKPVRDQPDG